MNDTVGEIAKTLEADLQTALTYAQRGELAQADTMYLRILQAHPDQRDALAFLGMRALQAGQHRAAIDYYARASAQDSENVLLLQNQAYAHIAAEQPHEARRLLERVIALAPGTSIAHLQLGDVLEHLGEKHLALVNYFTAITKAQARGRWMDPQTTPPTLRDLVTHAMRYVDIERKRLFQSTLAPLRETHGAALDRVMRCLDIYLTEVAPDYPDARQKPKFLYFPGLPTTAYFDRDLFPWYAQLESNTEAIRNELLAVLREEKGIEPFLKFNSADEIPRFLAGGEQGAPTWDAYFFYRHGKRNDENCARCPQTMAILDSLPTVNIRDHAPEICFSVLTPGTHILPHRGVTNTRLVTHLPLIVPKDCAIRVGGEEHAWQEGRCITFDDTFEHEAWNRSDETRVVLIVDCWNPHLTAIERAAITDLVVAIGEFNKECGIND